MGVELTSSMVLLQSFISAQIVAGSCKGVTEVLINMKQRVTHAQ